MKSTAAAAGLGPLFLEYTSTYDDMHSSLRYEVKMGEDIKLFDLKIKSIYWMD